MSKVCTNCSGKHVKAEGLCWPCLKPVREARGDVCATDGCGTVRGVGELCFTCYGKTRRCHCGKQVASEGLCLPHLREVRIERGDLCRNNDCDRPRFSKGLCSPCADATQYVDKTCPDCGVVFSTKKQAKAKTCRPCSAGRAGRLSNAAKSERARQRRLPVVHSGPVLEPWLLPGFKRSAVALPVTHPARAKSSGQIFVHGRCADCGDVFTAFSGQASAMYCSKRCVKRVVKRRRRAQKRGNAGSSPYSRFRVFERDGWRCQITDCVADSRVIPRGAVTPDPLAGVLDHVVPLAHGGADSAENVQAAHFLCNSYKGDRGVDQLRLVG